MAMVYMSADTRDELRKYKAVDGLTYGEAVEELLEQAGWYEDE